MINNCYEEKIFSSKSPTKFKIEAFLFLIKKVKVYNGF